MFTTVFVAVALLAYIFYRKQISSKSIDTTEKQVIDPNANRAPGQWYPEQFDYPHFEPRHDFDIKTTKPPPYRPFRYGPSYNMTMGLRSMQWEDWIEVDNRFAYFHEQRVKRQKEAQNEAVITLPGAEAAAREACLELSEFLSRRYPMVFSVRRNEKKRTGWYGDGEIYEIVIDGSAVISGVAETYNLELEDPMTICGALVQDEVILMIEGEDGQYRLMAGSICTPGFYRPKDKIGMTLEDIHLSGNVPNYKEKLHNPMARFFSKLRCDKAVVRNNYLFQIGDALVWSDRTNGPEYAYNMSLKGPDPKFIDGSFEIPGPNYDPAKVGFRTERQSLRRLPKTGAVLFTVRIYLDPMGELVKEPYIPGRMASAIRSWPENVAKYKGADMFNPEDVLLGWLDEKHSEQLASGEIEGDVGIYNYPY